MICATADKLIPAIIVIALINGILIAHFIRMYQEGKMNLIQSVLAMNLPRNMKAAIVMAVMIATAVDKV